MSILQARRWQVRNTNLTTIAGLAANNDDIIQRKAGAWTNRTVAQYLADLGATGKYPFPATQIASAGANDLDDYEEGIITPTLAFATPGNSSWAYAIQSGTYTKIGRLVTISVNLNATPTIGTGSGNLTIGGLPFTASSAADFTLAVDNLGSAFIWAASRTQVTGRVLNSSATAFLRMIGSAQSATTLAASNMTTGAAHALNLTGSYEV